MKNKTIIIGSGYVSLAYQNAGYPCISSEQFRYNGYNFISLVPFIKDYDVVINCIAKTDTRWSEIPNNFKELFQVNCLFVQELSRYCGETNKKLVHISTTDLYGNSHENSNTEDRTDLDVTTQYRSTKYIAEKLCDENDLILRIRLPFDGNFHAKNLLVKLASFRRFYHLSSDLTYLPDLVKATEILLDNNERGIFNITSETSTSMLYIARSLLDLPAAKDLDPHIVNDDGSPVHPDIMTEFSENNVHNWANIDKLKKYFVPSDLESSIINSFNILLTKGLKVVD
jgi:nucleoside-diphosphate-sugar epimerase